MTKTRLEAFSDAVIAIILTIMVLEMKVPHGDGIDVLYKLIPVFISYILSFIYIGIYWNNHHHMLHTVHKVNGSILWANLHLMFWLSLIPFATGWMGENHFTKWPMVVYGFVLLMCSIAYYFLSQSIIKNHNSDLAKAIGSDLKGKLSTLGYITAIALTFISPWISLGIYTLIAFVWFIPDTRIEKSLNH